MKCIFYRPVCFILLILLTISNLWSNLYVFRTLSPEGGFSYDGVTQTIQDSDGFIWILMYNNIYRFDGHEYRNYTQQFRIQNSSVFWTFINITSGKDKLYVTTNNSVFKYDKETDAFSIAVNASVEYAKLDNRGNLWIRHNRSWSIVDEEKDEFHTPLYDGVAMGYTSKHLYPYNDDLYVFTTNSKIYKYNYVTGEFNLCFNIPLVEGAIQDVYISKGKLWMYNDKAGLFKFDLATYAQEEQLNLPDQAIFRKLLVDKKGKIWLGTMNGIYIWDPESRQYTHYQNSKAFNNTKTHRFTIPHNSIWSLTDDSQGNIWIGTFAGGLCYVNLQENAALFSVYSHQHSGVGNAPVSGFAESKDCLWVATEGDGLSYVDKVTGTHSYFREMNKHQYSNNLKSLVVDKEENLWISSFLGGLFCLNLKTKEISNFVKEPDNPDSLLGNNLRKIILDGDSGLWIAYQDQQPAISYFSFVNKSFTHYNFIEDKTSYYVFDLLRSGNNKLWILSRDKLYLMDLSDKTTRSVLPDDSFFLYGKAMCMDQSGHIWIGTEGNGLIKYDPSADKYVIFNILSDYGVNAIYSILYDDGHLWLGTDHGLIRYTIEDNNIQVFGKEDNAQGDVYYPIATMKAANGNLYFGGTNGYTVITPGKVSFNAYKPQVIISDFLIDNISTGKRLNHTFTLKHYQTNFSIKFSSDNYLIAQKNRYRYRLRGYNDNWENADASNRMVSYSKVPAGTYYFEIMAANNDGLWNDTPKILKIIRKPAPWFSVPAYLLYLIVLIAILLMIIRNYTFQKKLKIQLYLDEIEKNKKEEIHQSQLRFFTNISHDFRTPLTLIMGVLGKIKQDGIKEYYYRILHNNVQRLLNLVNELMEFRTIENGKMNLHIEAFDVKALVKTIAEDFKDYASQRNIRFEINLDEKPMEETYIDRQIVEKISMNLLNNAFKYTCDKGSISIEMYMSDQSFQSRFVNQYTVSHTEEYKEYLVIAVRDTGVGISEDSISSVFERFYKVNTTRADAHLGTGIGLALVKALVLLHKGRISIFSERDKGTEIVVHLPYKKEVYQEIDFIHPTGGNEQVTAVPHKITPVHGSREILKRPKKKILIAEDNIDLRGLMGDFLAVDYDIMEAGDGIEATEIINKMEIDLVVSDIMMPGKDGVNLSREIKEKLETSHIPVILLTAKTDLESKLEGAEAGADIYLEKPIDFNLLSLSIENIFRQRVKLREYYAKNYFVDSPELAINEQDNRFLKKITEILDRNLNHPELDVNFLARELCMSRSKLYVKIKALTDKSIVEFILSHRLRKAARIIAEENIPIRLVIERIGIESQAYFTNAFKKEFGETPSAFATKYRRN